MIASGDACCGDRAAATSAARRLERLPVQEIVPGLFRLSIPMTAGGLGWTTPYVFRGTDGISLFDTGYGTRGATVAPTEQLAELGCTPHDVRRLFVSHAHPDHLGMSKWIKDQAPGCELVMMGQE